MTKIFTLVTLLLTFTITSSFSQEPEAPSIAPTSSPGELQTVGPDTTVNMQGNTPGQERRENRREARQERRQERRLKRKERRQDRRTKRQERRQERRKNRKS